MTEVSRQQAIDELAEANRARWDMVETLLGFRDGDLEAVWPRAQDEARRLVTLRGKAA